MSESDRQCGATCQLVDPVSHLHSFDQSPLIGCRRETVIMGRYCF